MRATPVLLGIVIARNGAGRGDEGLNDLFTGVLVILVGGVAAAAIDASVIAYEDVPTQSPPVTVAPRLSLTKASATIGVGGTF